MDRVRPETLEEIKKKERAYPHEIRMMVAELETIRQDRPFEEPQPLQPKVRPGIQIMDEMYVLAAPIKAMRVAPRTGDVLKTMRVGEYELIKSSSGNRYVVWRIL